MKVASILSGVAAMLPYASTVSAGLAAVGIKVGGDVPDILATLKDTVQSVKDAIDKREVMAEASEVSQIELLLAEIEQANEKRAAAIDAS